MKKYDVLIIGSGPAGMNAALYASRMNLSVCVVEKGAPGGKMVNISKIENWIGDEIISGPELSMRMSSHIKANGVESLYGDVVELKEKENSIVLASGEVVEYKYLIIATGSSETVPKDVVGIYNYQNKGVSYCAICDGPLFKNKVVAVMGGGNSAIEEGTYLASVAKEVHIFARSTVKAEARLVDDLKNKNNVIIHEGEQVIELQGSPSLEKVITNKGEYEVSAFFPYIGLTPNTKFIKDGTLDMNHGFIKVNESYQTSIKNVFAIGDVVDKHVRQISTAVSDGTIAAKTIANLF